MGRFHDFRECLGTFNGLMLVGGSEMGGSTLGEHYSSIIVDTVLTTLSLCDVEGSIILDLGWASKRGVWASSWALENGSELGLSMLGRVGLLNPSLEQLST